MQRLGSLLVFVVLLLLVFGSSVFIVDQRRLALVFQFGEVVRVIDSPGLNFKVPLVQSVRYFDRRIQTMDAEEPETFNTIEKKNLLVDSYVKWRIINAENFYKAVGGNHVEAKARLRRTVNDVLRAQVGKHLVQDVITDKRDEIMEIVRTVTDEQARKMGVAIVDVRLKRVDFTKEISTAVYERMASERKTVANKLRSEGAAEAERIRADADRQREIILAEAYNQAQQLKGGGDAEAAAIYAAAYSKDPEFYNFYKSLDVYRHSFNNKSDLMVIDANSALFKYFRQPERSLAR